MKNIELMLRRKRILIWSLTVSTISQYSYTVELNTTKLSSFCKIYFHAFFLFVWTTICAFASEAVLFVRVTQANLQQMKSKMWLVIYETNNKDETYPSVLIPWPVMSCLPASPSYYKNQTNLFYSKHAWQPVLENYRSGHTTNKQTNKKLSAFNGRRKGTGMAKKSNACRRRKKLRGLSSYFVHIHVPPPVFVHATNLVHLYKAWAHTHKCIAMTKGHFKCRYCSLTAESHHCTDPCPLDWLHKVWTDKSWRAWAHPRISLSQQDRPQRGKPSMESLDKRHQD